MNSIGKCVLVLLATMIILSSAEANAQPSEVWVDDDFCNGCPNDGHTWGFDAFAKIQDGINAVASPGTVHVASGTYVENINFFGKAITVTSEEGPEVTIINGNQVDSAVTFTSGEGPTSVINGFTIQNGRAGFDGGGIRIVNSSPTITGNVITNNRACTEGAGIGIRSSSSIIQDNIITNNRQSGCSGGGEGELVSLVILMHKYSIMSFPIISGVVETEVESISSLLEPRQLRAMSLAGTQLQE